MIKKVGQIFLDITEKVVPGIAFSVMFLVFVLQIFFRYVLNRPLIWPYEVSIFGFIWTTLFGACFAYRMRAHVVFSLVYDRRGPLGKWLFRIIGNTLIVVTFLVAFYPTYDYVKFMKIDKSTALKIPFNIVFFPYLIFLLLISARVAYDIVVDIRNVIRGELK